MNKKIINLRALAILLIVFGHSIIIYDPSFKLLQSNVEVPFLASLKGIISFIQLKLFFMISGFCMYYSVNKRNILGSHDLDSFISFTKNKFHRILIPYLTIAFLWMDPIKYLLNIEGYANPLSFIPEQLIGINCGHLWYLPCLFIIMIIVNALTYLGKSLKSFFIIFFALSAISLFHDSLPEIFQLNNVCYYLPYFFAGFLLNSFLKSSDRKTLLFTRKSIIIENIIFILLIILAWKYSSNGFVYTLSMYILLLMYFVTPNKTNKTITFISDNSFGLYLFHSPLIYITARYMPDINPILMVIINFILFGGISLCLSYFISKSRLRFVIGDFSGVR